MKYLIGLVLLLTACAPKVDTHAVDPSWPAPIMPYQAKWEVHVINGVPFVGMPFDESQKFRIFMDDTVRYVKDANDVICYYRSHLEEPKCK
ncbi:outer membrane lipoprotein Rz1 [Serratia phage 4S]|nr:outer membrane lipoprotein Rz1 [Serratia phage 4S]